MYSLAAAPHVLHLYNGVCTECGYLREDLAELMPNPTEAIERRIIRVSVQCATPRSVNYFTSERTYPLFAADPDKDVPMEKRLFDWVRAAGGFRCGPAPDLRRTCRV